MLKEYMQHIRGGGLLSFEQALALAVSEDPEKLFEAADQVRREFHNDNLDLCSIVNAKAGKCSEDCRFCAQSGHYDVDVKEYNRIDEETLFTIARENNEHGVQRLSLVTAGKSVSNAEIEEFGEVYSELSQNYSFSYCASMGMLTPEKAERLKEYGVSRYHCNLETCRSFFPNICTTHSWEDKVDSIKIARAAGLEVCSGGIIGLGESLENRLELAFELRELEVLSIPLNILTPIENTPLFGVEPISLSEVLVCISMFRLIHPQATIRLAGGRGTLGPDQYKCFTSGANGAIVGDYLTTAGNSLKQDLEMFTSLGFEINR